MNRTDEICEYFASEIRQCAGDSLRSLILYGSALTEDFIPKKSDYNFVVVADPLEVTVLDLLAGRSKAWSKKRIPVPQLFTESFIKRATDSYPLEFLGMKARYRVVAGADVLAAVEVEKPDVRLQCERELRAKLLLFRRVYVGTGGKPKHLRMLVTQGLPALAAIIRGLLYYKDHPWKEVGSGLWDAAARHLGLPGDLLHRLQNVRDGRKPESKDDAKPVVQETIQLLDRLAREVDQW